MTNGKRSGGHDEMKWNVFSLEAVKEALKPKFVLEKVRYVTDHEEYGEGESTRLVFRNVEEIPEIDCIKRTISTFIREIASAQMLSQG